MLVNYMMNYRKGEFKNDKPEGYGEKTWPDGKIYRG
jgi:hypothetical protein